MKILNTRFWLLATGTLFTIFPTINALSGQTVASAPSYWPGTLSAREAEIAAVVELAWGFHILALGLVALAIALLSPDPLRARLGVVVTVAFALSQGLSAGTAAQFGYGGTDGMGLFAIVVIGVPLITLITCAVRWNARPVSTR
jgi:hypothetical protein